MKIIVDSGSTKSDWIVIDDYNEVCGNVQTFGLNPTVLTQNELYNIIKGDATLEQLKTEITQIYFYGAACSTPQPKQLMTDVLKSVFTKAKIEVYEDTLAAVRATIDAYNQTAVVCILGTGSNACYYDGQTVHNRINSLGFSIMDDASGSYFGRLLLRDYFFNKMPLELSTAFKERFNLDPDFIKQKLYKEASPNVYLAAFAKFMFSHYDSFYVKNILTNGIESFVDTTLSPYKEELSVVPIHFVGSIAHLAQIEIHAIANKYNITVGNIIRRPISRLVNYHTTVTQNIKP